MTNDQIKQLIREVIAEGIDLDIPDAEISRVVSQDTAQLRARVAVIEEKISDKPETAKVARIDAIKAAAARVAKKGAQKAA